MTTLKKERKLEAEIRKLENGGDNMVDITVNVNTEKMQKQIKELDLTEINDLKEYLRERIEVERIGDVMFVSLKEGD